MCAENEITVLLEGIVQALQEFDVEQVRALATTALSKNISPLTVIEEGIAKGLREIGRQYEEGSLFITHLVAAAETARATLDEVLTPALKASSESIQKSRPRIVLATVEGDIHDIGKNIVGAMLFAGGFEVIDIGKDVPATQIVEAVRTHQPALLGLSSLLSTSMAQMPRVLEQLEEEKLRDTIKVIVGGGPVTAEWAKSIGADGYGSNAAEAVKVARRLLE